MPKSGIYLDHAATTPVDKQVLEAMLPYFNEHYANPSSRHTLGYQAKEALDKAREQIANHLQCRSDEITFTSGGTESNNLALFGLKPKHLITTAIEHSSILETCHALEKQGTKVTYLKPDAQGLISPTDLNSAIAPETDLISIIYANNEIGTIQDIPALSAIAQAHNIPFHSDACQAAGYLTSQPATLGADLITLNASKIYGPKGAGLLYHKRGLTLQPLLHGGHQENGLRSGTENLPAIIGLAHALSLTSEIPDCTNLRDQLTSTLLQNIPGSELNGHPTQRLPNNINIYIPNIDIQNLLLHLDEQGIYVSTGSACQAGSTEPSHVLLALGQSPERATNSLRITLGKHSTEAEISQVATTLPKLVSRLS